MRSSSSRRRARATASRTSSDDDADRRRHHFAEDHLRILVGNTRAVLRLAMGDPAGARENLRQAYAAALETGDRPILSLVAVTAAALAAAHGRHRESAVLLGTAARLRGVHDRTDWRIGDLTRRGQAALGEQAFAAAYRTGWQLDVQTTVATLESVSGLKDAASGDP
ncbi:hypothetical protein ACIBD9_24845 [Micromonospora sp. NPDC050784]|uniref:hypothetical protein n=1 Tax=Micromonospora sp. NPDC050784 TaxID=3364281 RepID=UPI0037A05A95